LPSIAVIQREWQHLFDRFADRLLSLQPASVLDVGCGRGLLIDRLAQAGVPATGVDPAADGASPQILAATADKLPFADNAFDWVTLRHVPHHLPNVAAALAECGRVARTGMLIAEPWFDPTKPAQRVAQRWDHWWKRQHERAGDVHRPCLSLLELQAALPRGTGVEADYYGREAQVGLDVIDEMSRPLLEKLPDADPDHAEYEDIRRAIGEDGFTYNGTLIVTARRNS